MPNTVEVSVLQRLSRLGGLLLALFSGPAVRAADSTPDFSGTWKLNVSASFLAGDHPFAGYELTKTLRLDGQTLHQTQRSTQGNFVNIPMPDSTLSTDYILDGQEHVTIGEGIVPNTAGPQVRVVCAWQGNTLLITERNVSTDEASYAERRMYLTADGQHLIELINARRGYGDTEQRLVFDR